MVTIVYKTTTTTNVGGKDVTTVTTSPSNPATKPAPTLAPTSNTTRVSPFPFNTGNTSGPANYTNVYTTPKDYTSSPYKDVPINRSDLQAPITEQLQKQQQQAQQLQNQSDATKSSTGGLLKNEWGMSGTEYMKRHANDVPDKPITGYEVTTRDSAGNVVSGYSISKTNYDKSQGQPIFNSNTISGAGSSVMDNALLSMQSGREIASTRGVTLIDQPLIIAGTTSIPPEGFSLGGLKKATEEGVLIGGGLGVGAAIFTEGVSIPAFAIGGGAISAVSYAGHTLLPQDLPQRILPDFQNIGFKAQETFGINPETSLLTSQNPEQNYASSWKERFKANPVMAIGERVAYDVYTGARGQSTGTWLDVGSIVALPYAGEKIGTFIASKSTKISQEARYLDVGISNVDTGVTRENINVFGVANVQNDVPGMRVNKLIGYASKEPLEATITPTGDLTSQSAVNGKLYFSDIKSVVAGQGENKLFPLSKSKNPAVYDITEIGASKEYSRTVLSSVEPIKGKGLGSVEELVVSQQSAAGVAETTKPSQFGLKSLFSLGKEVEVTTASKPVFQEGLQTEIRTTTKGNTMDMIRGKGTLSGESGDINYKFDSYIRGYKEVPVLDNEPIKAVKVPEAKVKEFTQNDIFSIQGSESKEFKLGKDGAITSRSPSYKENIPFDNSKSNWVDELGKPKNQGEYAGTMGLPSTKKGNALIDFLNEEKTSGSVWSNGKRIRPDLTSRYGLPEIEKLDLTRPTTNENVLPYVNTKPANTGINKVIYDKADLNIKLISSDKKVVDGLTKSWEESSAKSSVKPKTAYMDETELQTMEYTQRIAPKEYQNNPSYSAISQGVDNSIFKMVGKPLANNIFIGGLISKTASNLLSVKENTRVSSGNFKSFFSESFVPQGTKVTQPRNVQYTPIFQPNNQDNRAYTLTSSKQITDTSQTTKQIGGTLITPDYKSSSITTLTGDYPYAGNVPAPPYNPGGGLIPPLGGGVGAGGGGGDYWRKPTRTKRIKRPIRDPASYLGLNILGRGKRK